jgi:ribosomal protein L1
MLVVRSFAQGTMRRLVPMKCRCHQPQSCFSSYNTSLPLQRAKVKYPLEQAIDILRKRCEGYESTTFTVNVNLNLDPRIKGQKLQGVFDLPHNTAKVCRVVALTSDPDLAEAALSAGAGFAGDIVQHIISNQIQWPKSFERLITTYDFERIVVPKKLLMEKMKKNKNFRVDLPHPPSRLAAKLKKHKIVPCSEDKTLVTPEELVDAVRGYANGGYVHYITDVHGNVTCRFGQTTMENPALIENFNQILRHLFETQAPVFGTGPRAKKSNIGKYVLGIHLAVSRAESYALNLDLIDILKERNHQDIPITKNWRNRVY